VDVPGVGRYPVGAEQQVRTNGISAGLTYQFFENQWAHPFVFGGVALDFDRTRIRTWAQSYYRGDPRIPGNEIVIGQHGIRDLGTSREVRGVFGTGAKLYMSPRSFFKTDLRVNVGPSTRSRSLRTAGGGSRHVSFRLGVGLDF
jgi:hypothetical protein